MLGLISTLIIMVLIVAIFILTENLDFDSFYNLRNAIREKFYYKRQEKYGISEFDFLFFSEEDYKNFAESLNRNRLKKIIPDNYDGYLNDILRHYGIPTDYWCFQAKGGIKLVSNGKEEIWRNRKEAVCFFLERKKNCLDEAERAIYKNIIHDITSNRCTVVDAAGKEITRERKNHKMKKIKNTWVPDKQK